MIIRRRRSLLSTLLKFLNFFIYFILLFIQKDNAVVPVLNETAHKPSDEHWYIVALQVLFPFFMAGFGMVGAGVVLDKVTVRLETS